MEIIFMYVAGIIVFVIAIIAIVRGITYRIKSPADDLKEQISILERRVDDLEKIKKDDS
ncbi:hypothetical protein [Oceanobacillus sp. CF4.6]|uniref:hypothetical protein n=1 Tax=Oceanobacillus sp. CF4.6 TaxID=3373080 RepID=UPI003EE546F1